jgi:K+-transporting ATPase ATPase C chain
MIKALRGAVIAFVIFTVLTGVVYPLLVTVIGQAAFPAQANGSLVEQDSGVIGSTLIGQTTDDPRYFRGRPSAIGTMQGGALTASGASNAGWTNASLAAAVQERAAAVREANGLADDAPIPDDLLFASASGIDPHISPQAAAVQVERVATARGLDPARVTELVTQFTQGPQFGILGQARVNVLLLNLSLDGLQ